jgi:multimeric flavodoxin WrbA
MKVIGFNASPRNNGNTATLVNSVLKGAQDKGAEVRYVNLHKLNMKGCLGCDKCNDDLGKCVQKDDLSPILRDLRDYDAVVLGTPTYWWHVHPQLKMLTDRFWCYFYLEENPETGDSTVQTVFPADKKFVMVTSRGEPENAQSPFPEFYGYMLDWLKIVAKTMGASSIEVVNQFGAFTDRDAARNDPGLIDKAESVGASLV